MFLIFLKVITIGFICGAPLGSTTVLTLKRIIQNGFWAGIYSGLGVAVADSIYTGMLILSMHWLSDFFTGHHAYLNVCGGIIMLVLALHTFFSKTQKKTSESSAKQSAGYFLTTFILAFTHPLTLLFYTALFAKTGLLVKADWPTAQVMMIGVFIGSMSWWVILSLVVCRYKMNISEPKLSLINKIVAIVLLAFAVYWIVSSYYQFH